jgi:ubiquinone/menaquinone biosynthesis C-methylase UbiE
MNDNEKTVIIYSTIAKKYADTFYNELLKKPIDCKFYDLFIDRLPKKGVCLEIGCGPGEIANYFFQKGVKVIGIDKSKEMIEVAEGHNDKIEFMVGDVFDLNLENAKYDGVVAPYLIVNFSNKEVVEAISEMRRVLKERGKLLIVFHVGNNRKLIIKNFFGSGMTITFILHKIKKIKKILRNNGFIITEVVMKEPYEGEVTNRAYIYAEKNKSAKNQ